jgi:hypothetical protein
LNTFAVAIRSPPSNVYTPSIHVFGGRAFLSVLLVFLFVMAGLETVLLQVRAARDTPCVFAKEFGFD